VERKLTPEVKQALLTSWEPLYRSRLNYLVTWSTRGRRPVLRERHIAALEEMVRQACEERGFALAEVAAGPDHVHVLVGLRPSHSISSVVRELKGRAGVALLQRFPELRVWLRGNLVWDERYAVETVSSMRIERIQERLRNLHGPSDDFARAS
jgi:putative transposase